MASDQLIIFNMMVLLIDWPLVGDSALSIELLALSVNSFNNIDLVRFSRIVQIYRKHMPCHCMNNQPEYLDPNHVSHMFFVVVVEIRNILLSLNANEDYRIVILLFIFCFASNQGMHRFEICISAMNKLQFCFIFIFCFLLDTYRSVSGSSLKTHLVRF